MQPSFPSLRLPTAAACLLAVALPLPAQDLPRLRAPIRVAAADPGQTAARPAAWAAGHDYKVCFAEDRVTFYPVLGAAAPRSLPVSWTTTAVLAGDVSLVSATAPAQQALGDWRFERRFGVMTEAWNVREDGVEQTFVFAAPLGAGDLVVRGRLESELVAAPFAAARHADLVLRDADGNAVVRYGAARAFDAAGRWLDLMTAFDGRQVELRVPAGWLAAATWPVTIDPLLSSTVVATGSQTVGAVHIAADEESKELLIGVTRAISSGDHDAYVYVTGEALGAGTLILADQSAAYDTRIAAPAYVGGADAWVIALERQARGLGRPMLGYQVRARRNHARNDTLTEIPLAASVWPRDIDLGGSSSFASGRHALLVFQADTSRNNNDLSDIMGVVIDAYAKTHGQVFVLPSDGSSSARNVDRERPTVQHESLGASEGWIVAWQEASNAAAGDDWDLYCLRLWPSGSRSVRSWLGTADDRAHSVTPRLAGRDGEYLVVYGEVVNQGWRVEDAEAPILRAQRFQWKTSQTTPVQGEVRTLAVGSAAYRAFDLAFDTRTTWHWCAAWRDANSELYAARLGYDGLLAESAHLTAGTPRGTTAAVAYDLNARDFVAAYGTDETSFPVRARRFVYPTTAQVLIYGQGCGGEALAIDPPHAGHGAFTVGMNGLPASAPVLVLLGTLPANLPLDGIGMTGCRLLIDPASLLVILPASASSFGQARPALPLPSTLRADLRLQMAWLEASANAAGLAIGRGFLVQVR